MVAGTKDAVLMVESEAKCLSEEVMLGAVVFGHQQMQVAIKAINEIVGEAAKARIEWKPDSSHAELDAAVGPEARAPLSEAYRITEKQARYAKIRRNQESRNRETGELATAPSSPRTKLAMRSSDWKATSCASAF